MPTSTTLALDARHALLAWSASDGEHVHVYRNAVGADDGEIIARRCYPVGTLRAAVIASGLNAAALRGYSFRRAFAVRRCDARSMRAQLAATARWMGWGWVRTYR